jgi:signal transduction histidine kinase
MDEKDKIIAQLKAEVEELKIMHQTCMINNANISQSLTLLDNLINTCPLSIQIMNAEGKEIRANAAHRKIFQGEPNNNFSIFSDPQIEEGGLGPLFKRLKTGETISLPPIPYNPFLQNPELPNHWMMVQAVAFPVFDHNKQPVQYVLMHEDITERVKMENEISEKNQLLEAQKQWMLEKIEEEREKFAKVIHTYFGHNLACNKIKLENLQMDMDDPNEYEKTQIIVTGLEEMIVECKKLTSDWRRYTEIVSDFLADMHRMVDEFAEDNDINTIFNRDKTIKLSSKKALILHNILEEALSNISRYAMAKNVRISLKKKANNAIFSIIDDGIGITKKQLQSKKAFGLMYMHEHTNMLGGKFSIGKHEDKGTEIYIDFPIKK